MNSKTWFAATSAAAVAVLGSALVLPSISEAAGTDASDSLVEDYSYPGADKILAEHNLKLFKGDGHLLFSSRRTLDQGQCPTGEIQVEKQMSEEPFGMYYCFKATARKGFLTLEVPNTFGVRAGDAPVKATATLPDGEQKTYDVPANRPVAISPGSGDDAPQAVLVELRVDN